MFPVRTLPESRPLGIEGAELVGISASGEMAILRRPPLVLLWGERLGTLARAPLAGGSPRDLLENVLDADWSADGSTLAAVVAAGHRVEFPLGKPVHKATRLRRVRVSPQGDRLAFAERPLGLSSTWSIVLLNRQGEKVTLPSGESSDYFDLVWAPGADEIWFTGRYGGTGRLLAVNRSGRIRELIPAAWQPQIFDVAANGQALVARTYFRVGIMGVPPGETKERDLSWLDQMEGGDLSADGKTLAVTSLGEERGLNRWSIYLRKADGSGGVHIGDGNALAFSPDGKQVLTSSQSERPELVLLPTGAGTPVTLPRGPIVDYWSANWLPDGKRIVFAGSEAGRGLRYYVQDLAGGAPRAITGEGVQLRIGQKAVSPDGKSVAAIEPDGGVAVYPIDGGGQKRPIPNYPPWDRPIYYTYMRTLSDLYLVEGLR